MQEWLCHICRLSPSLAGGGGAVPVYLCWVWQSVSQSVPAASLHSYLLSSPQLRSTSRTQSLLNIPSHHTTLTIIFSYLFLSTHVFYSFFSQFIPPKDVTSPWKSRSRTCLQAALSVFSRKSYSRDSFVCLFISL